VRDGAEEALQSLRLGMVQPRMYIFAHATASPDAASHAKRDWTRGGRCGKFVGEEAGIVRELWRASRTNRADGAALQQAAHGQDDRAVAVEDGTAKEVEEGPDEGVATMEESSNK
jgi:hypothetical protein